MDDSGMHCFWTWKPGEELQLQCMITHHMMPVLLYKCTHACKSDHLITKMEVVLGNAGVRNEAHKWSRYNYSKANFDALGRYFENLDWTKMGESKYCALKIWRFYEVYQYNKEVRRQVIFSIPQKEWEKSSSLITDAKSTWRKEKMHGTKLDEDSVNKFGTNTKKE